MTVPLVAGALCVAAVALVILTLRRLARPRREMYARISARCADIAARAAQRALVYDRPPVRRPSVDGTATTGAGTPDPAPVVVPQRVHIEMGGPGRHRMVA